MIFYELRACAAAALMNRTKSGCRILSQPRAESIVEFVQNQLWSFLAQFTNLSSRIFVELRFLDCKKKCFAPDSGAGVLRRVCSEEAEIADPWLSRSFE